MTSRNNKNSSDGRVNSSSIDLNNLDLDNLSAEQIAELLDKVSGDLAAAANNAEAMSSTNSESAPRPPWINFT